MAYLRIPMKQYTIRRTVIHMVVAGAREKHTYESNPSLGDEHARASRREFTLGAVRRIANAWQQEY